MTRGERDFYYFIHLTSVRCSAPSWRETIDALGAKTFYFPAGAASGILPMDGGGGEEGPGGGASSEAEDFFLARGGNLSLVSLGAAWGLIFGLRVQQGTGGRLLTQHQNRRVHTHT